MEYAWRKDVLHVMNMLSHKSIRNTMMYTQLINFETDEYTVKVSRSLEEDQERIKAGFE